MSLEINLAQYFHDNLAQNTGSFLIKSANNKKTGNINRKEQGYQTGEAG